MSDAQDNGHTDVQKVIEALLFSSDRPITVEKMKEGVGTVTTQAVRECLKQIEEDCKKEERVYSLQKIGGGWQFLTCPEYGDYVNRIRKGKTENRLSPAALETLAIIAYRQPVKRIDVESVRGVQAGPLIRALMEKKLVKIVDRENAPGNPVRYGTTKDFLETVGLNSLKDLPRPEELE